MKKKQKQNKSVVLKQLKNFHDYPYQVIELVNEMRFDVGQKLTREELAYFIEKNPEVEVRIR